MLVYLLKSKIHMAVITSSNVEYEGSIAIDPELLSASGLYVGEKVAVLNFDNGNRFETYVIEGVPGEVGLRGPAAKLGKIKERVIILSYGLFSENEVKNYKAKVIILDGSNKIKYKK